MFWRTGKYLVIVFLLIHPVISGAQPLEEVYQSAEAYLVDQFNYKDVILLGEAHRIKEHAEFVGRTIPALHRAGVNLLYSEFALSEDTALINSLITAPIFDESLARFISWKDMWDWAYREYVDIYYAAWKVNQSLLPGEEPFRIIGLESNDDGILDPEMVWARMIKNQALARNRKAVVWCGLHHAFSNFYQPYYLNDSLQGFVMTRLGNILYRNNPGRVMTVVLHAPLMAAIHSPLRHVIPCDGKIDSVVYQLPEGQREIGFSTNESWLGNCTLEQTFYSTGYVRLTLKNLCQGYIVVKPVCELNMVTLIPGFINDSNIAQTRKMAELGDLSPEALNDTIRVWLENESSFLLDVQKRNCVPPR